MQLFEVEAAGLLERFLGGSDDGSENWERDRHLIRVP
jgi:hypothetical protein